MLYPPKKEHIIVVLSGWRLPLHCLGRGRHLIFIGVSVSPGRCTAEAGDPRAAGTALSTQEFRASEELGRSKYAWEHFSPT